MNDRQKAILYRAKHRGSKEADFLVGGFIDSLLAASKTNYAFSEKDTAFLEEFVSLDDNFLIDIVSVKDDLLTTLQNPILIKFFLFWRNKQNESS